MLCIFFSYKTGLTTSQFLHLVFNRRNVICSKAGEEKADLLTNRTVLFCKRCSRVILRMFNFCLNADFKAELYDKIQLPYGRVCLAILFSAVYSPVHF